MSGQVTTACGAVPGPGDFEIWQRASGRRLASNLDGRILKLVRAMGRGGRARDTLQRALMAT